MGQGQPATSGQSVTGGHPCPFAAPPLVADAEATLWGRGGSDALLESNDVCEPCVATPDVRPAEAQNPIRR